MDRCDGTRSIADIAAELEIPFQSAWEVVNQLADKKLVRLSYEGLLHD
jgi:Mn-dependent DtxR family transcriptional regulator